MGLAGGFYDTAINQDRWHGKAHLPLDMLPASSASTWRLNATAIHGPKKARVYQSHTTLTGDKPDFHQPDLFKTHLVG